jgi:hypothetical protein
MTSRAEDESLAQGAERLHQADAPAFRAALDWRRAAWAATGVASLLVTLCFTFPAYPGQPNYSLDGSWVLVLNSAFERGMRFGRDIVFTFGPLGFVGPRGYDPVAFPYVMLVWTALGAALWWAAFDLAARVFRHPIPAFVWITFLVLVVTVGGDQFLFAIPTLLFVKYFYVDEDRPSASTAALAAAAACGGLIKFSFLTAGAVVAVAIALDETIWRRRVPVVASVFGATVVGLWVLCSQHLADFWPYLRTSLELARGYGEAMAAMGPSWDVLAYAGAAAAAFVTMLEVWRRSGGIRGAIPVGVSGAILLLLFKAGYVRHDPHALIGSMGVLCLVMLLVPACWGKLPWAPGRLLCAASLAAAVGLTAVHYSYYLNSSFPAYLAFAIKTIPGRLADAARVVRGAETLNLAYAHSLATIRAQEPLPPAKGSVDIYPHNQALVIAHDMPYRPRPVFQSYAAYTPALASLNAAHLRGPDAADTIFFDLSPIDGRLPALEDGASWPELLSRYDIVGRARQFLVLERAEHAREYELVPLGEVQGRLGEPIAIPEYDGGPIWARVGIRSGLAGGLLRQLYKSPPIAITVRTRGGEHSYRFLPSVASGGFLLSPHVADKAAFASLASTAWREDLAGAQVESITLSTSGRLSRVAYDPEVTLTLSRLEFPRRDLAGVQGVQDMRTLYLLSRTATGPGPGAAIGTGPDGAPVVTAHTPTTLTLPLPEGAKRLRLGFGIAEGAWKGQGATDGVEFRVSALVGGQPRVLWSRYLDPRKRPADRGNVEAEVDLSGVGASSLLLETLPGPNGAWDWSYWSKVSVE